MLSLLAAINNTDRILSAKLEIIRWGLYDCSPSIMLRAPNHVPNLVQHDADKRITSALKPMIISCSASSLPVGAVRNHFFVRTRPIFFRLSWLLFALIHGLTASFLAAWTWAYWTLPATLLGVSFEIYRISLPLSEFRILAVCHGAVAFCHAWILVRMIAWSVYYRRFVFSAQSGRPRDTKTSSRCAIFSCNGISMASKKIMNRLQQVFWSTWAYRHRRSQL